MNRTTTAGAIGLVGASVLAHLPASQAAVLTGRSFFPSLISGPFASGLHTAFDFAIAACLVAAGMSWLRGGKYRYQPAPGELGADMPTVNGGVLPGPPAAAGAAALSVPGRNVVPADSEEGRTT